MATSPQDQQDHSNLDSDESSEKDPRDKLFHPDPGPFYITPSPHLSKTANVPLIMWSVVLALLPTAIMSVYYFGFPAFRLVTTCIIVSILTESGIVLIRKKKLSITDGSAAITGLLLALTLPPTLSVTSAAIGSVFAIAIGKQVFGGLGYNIFNPALIGRAFLQASFPVDMTRWVLPFKPFDGVSAATPLGLFKFEKITTSLTPLLIGDTGGSIGETCALALMAGGIFLLVFRFADWRIPLSILTTVFLLTSGLWLIDPINYANPLFHLMSGGLLLGALFMATDMVTSPITPKGNWIYGAGIGVLVVVIRLLGGLPEGVMYSILLMNALTPLINRYTRPRYFGEVH